MKTIKYMLSALVTLAIIPAAYGQRPIETLQLTDGTILNGYVKEYSPDGTRIFLAESAIYTIPVDSAQKVLLGEKRINIKDLDGDNLKFQRENPELFNKFVLHGNTGATSIRTAAYSKDSSSLSTPVLVANLDSRDMKQFVVLTPQTVTVPADKLEAILYFPDQNAKVGLYDVIIDKDGMEYIGFKTEENIAKDDVKIECGGTTDYINYENIVSVGYMPIDEDTDILDQTPWLKEYKFKNGESIRGVATVIDYENGIIKIATPGQSHDTHIIKTKNIEDYAGYSTERNEFAVTKPADKLDFSDNKLYVNNKEITPLNEKVTEKAEFTIKNEQAKTNFPVVDRTTRKNVVSVVILNGNAGQASIKRVYPDNKGNYNINKDEFNTADEIYTTMSFGKEGETIYTFGKSLEPGKYILELRGLGRYYPFAVE